VGAAVVSNLGVIAIFCLPGILLWWHAWDGHLGTTLACACGDSGQQVWFIAWPAYALQHGLNPFFSRALWAPSGVNLLSNASSPLVGVTLAPVTWAAGPIVATNLALVLAPALSGWGCWFACRRMLNWAPAAWIAGLLFGYSPFIVDNDATGHVGVALLVVPPLLMLLAYRLVTGRTAAVAGGVAFGLLVVAQFLISTEVLAVTVVVGVLGLAGAAAWAPGRVRSSWRPIAGAGLVALGVAGALLALPAWFAVAGPRHIAGSPWPGLQIEGNRLVDVIAPGLTGVPNRYLELGGYEGPAGPPSAYIGPVVVALVLGAVVIARRRRTTRVLATVALATGVLSLGAVLWTSGSSLHGRLWLPWRVLGSLPVLDEIGPQRFSALADLLVATVIALGLDACWRATARWRGAPEVGPDDGTGRRRALSVGVAAALVALCLAALMPIWAAYHAPLATRSVSRPSWLTAVAPSNGTRPSVLLVYPFPMSATAFSAPMVWQSLDAMSFRLAGGYVKVPGPGGRALVLGSSHSPERLLATLSFGVGPLSSPARWQIDALGDEVASAGISSVVVTDAGRAPSYAAELFTAALRRQPTWSSGSWTWKLDGRPVGARSAPAPAARSVRAFGNCRKLVGPAADRWRSVAGISRCIVAQEGASPRSRPPRSR